MRAIPSLGQSWRWQNIFTIIPSDSSLWFEGNAIAPCGEAHVHPAQRHHGAPGRHADARLSKYHGVATGIQGKVPSRRDDDVLTTWCVYKWLQTSWCGEAQHLQWSLYFLCWIAQLPLPPEATTYLGWYLDCLNWENNYWDGFFFLVDIFSHFPACFTYVTKKHLLYMWFLSPLQMIALYNFQVSAR